MSCGGPDAIALARPSMGPASENAGYHAWHSSLIPAYGHLQWVRRPRTPVILDHKALMKPLKHLQWVRRPRTPVIEQKRIASLEAANLQWVRRPRTPVIARPHAGRHPRLDPFNGSGVRERRLC